MAQAAAADWRLRSWRSPSVRKESASIEPIAVRPSYRPVLASPTDNCPPSLRARATIVPRHCEPERSEGEAIQSGRASAVDSGLLRRLRRLATTVETPPRHCERERRASAKQSRNGAATRYAPRPSRAAPPAWIASAASPPRNDGGRGGALASRPRLEGRPRYPSRPHGNSAICSRPMVSGQPITRFIFWIAWPEAPL